MRLDEIIMEAQLTPGQVKPIKVKIAQYQKELKDLERKQEQLDNQFRFGDLNNLSGPEYEDLQDKLAGYINAYTAEIDRLKAELVNKHSDKGFENLLAGIKKNCSEVIDFYRDRKKFMYAGFKNAGEHSALYAKTPTRIIMPEAYEKNHFRETANFIEKFGFGSFTNGILCNGYAYEVSQDQRHPFIIFPVNGYKFFYGMHKARLRLADREIPEIFDKALLHNGWRALVKDPIMREEFIKNGAILESFNELDIRYAGGFMGLDTYKSQLDAISKMIDDDKLDKSWNGKDLWENWVTKDSFQRKFNMDNTNLGWALSNQIDVIVNTPAVYAINMDHTRTIQDALGMKDYY